MKNLIKKVMVVLSFAIILILGTVSYAADTVGSNIIQEYNGKTYSCINYLCNGKIKDSSVTPLPYSLDKVNINAPYKMDFVMNFAIYNDRIYYLKSNGGTSCVVGNIYSCNMDGSDIKLIANDADALYNFFISDGCMYYKVLDDVMNDYGRYLNGGIMKINLNTGEYRKIITDMRTEIINILDDNIFYGVDGKYHLMKTSGRYVGGIANNDIEVSTVISGNLGYYCENGSVYSRDWNGNIKWICSTPNYFEGYDVYGSRGVTVVDRYIYYTIYTGIMTDQTDVVLMKVPISGGTSTTVGKWFIS